MDTLADDGRLLSVGQAMEILKCGKKKLYQLHRTGQLEMVKLGSSTRIPERSLRALINQLPRREAEKK